ASYFRRSGGGPLSFQLTEGQRDNFAINFGRAEVMYSADELNAALFGLLDTNKDGKLSKEELAAAPWLLKKLDGNDDEVISFQEFSATLPKPKEPRGRKAPPPPARPGGPGQEAPVPAFVQVMPGRGKDLARQVLRKYAAKDSKRVTAKDIGLD